jgi:hypothetical protein
MDALKQHLLNMAVGCLAANTQLNSWCHRVQDIADDGGIDTALSVLRRHISNPAMAGAAAGAALGRIVTSCTLHDIVHGQHSADCLAPALVVCELSVR